MDRPVRASLALIALILITQPSKAADIGIASTFTDHRVACAPYRIDPYKVMGIAHKTLACGTKVEVTNVRNGKKVYAIVIDLGPCMTVYCQTKMAPRIRKRKFDLLPMVGKAVGSSGLAVVSVAAR